MSAGVHKQPGGRVGQFQACRESVSVGVTYHVCRILLQHVFVPAAYLLQFPAVPCRCFIVQASERANPR